MTSDNRDLLFLKEALPQMQEYLLSNELYWPLGAAMHRLTPGSVLLSLARLQGSLPSEVQNIRQQLESIRGKWRAAWDKKAAREISNRLRLWSNFLADYANAPEQCAGAYPGEVRGRVILQLLLLEAPDSPDNAALAELDGMLKTHLHPDRFLWDAGLQVVFPKENFWFLYGKL